MEIQGDSSSLSNQQRLKICQLIQNNCQFLTVIKKCITEQQILTKNNLKPSLDYKFNQKIKLSYQNLIDLLIQLGYFIYSSKYYKIALDIKKDYVRIQQVYIKANQKKFVPIIYYNINQSKPQPLYYINLIIQLYQYLFQLLKQYQNNNNQQNVIDCYKKNLHIFIKQYNFIKKYIHLFNQNNQRQFFKCLQQTTLFRMYSFMLKIKNNTILDYLRNNQNNLQMLVKFKNKDVILVNQYINQKKKQKGDHQNLKNKQREIQTNVVEFFKVISKKKDKMQEQSNNKIDKEQSFKVKFLYQLDQKIGLPFQSALTKIIPGFSQFIQQEQAPSKLSSKLQYHIEYSSQKNSICVRLLTSNINVNVQTSDFLMFQSNVLTFDTANVNIEMGDSKTLEKANVAKKTLAFKAASCFNTKQPPLQKILLLMDITMISSKIYQPQLNTPKLSNGTKDAHRISIIANKVNHYTKIFLKCAKKIYNKI